MWHTINGPKKTSNLAGGGARNVGPGGVAAPGADGGGSKNGAIF